MILYFADRRMDILGQASTGLPGGLSVFDDIRSEDVESGVSSFECRIAFDKSTHSKVEACVKEGNYLLRSHKGTNEFFTIIDVEFDSKEQTAYLYAESQGLDLLNEICLGYTPDSAKPIAHYIERFAYDSGFVIGRNDIPDETRLLTFTGESTATERLANVAAQFECELSYSFDIKGMKVSKKYINVHKKRGVDTGIQLRVNKEINRILTKRSVANLATALRVTGAGVNQERLVLETVGNGLAYALELETISRHQNSVTLEACVTASLTSDTATLGEDYGLTASVHIGGGWHTAVIKATDKENKQNWKGTTKHSTIFQFSLSGVALGVVEFSGIKFKVTRSDSKGGNTGILAETACANYRVTNYIAGGEQADDLNSRDITLDGYSYDDGDFFLEGTYLKSRNAVKEWSRYLAETGTYTGHICKTFSFDTSDQKKLCEKAIEELARICKPEENYEIELVELPEGVRIGDRVNVIDDAGNLYLAARLLKLEESAANQQCTATFGEYLLQTDGISKTVAAMSERFTRQAQSAAHALELAERAKAEATKAQAQAGTANENAENAQETANNANQTAQEAQETASEAQKMADDAFAAAEEAQNDATNAAKVATNYMDFTTGGGLQVGNKQSGSWSGTRAQIMPDSFNILDADGKVVASYGRKKVELGKDSTDSTIEMCGGVGVIQADALETTVGTVDSLNITADAASLTGKYAMNTGVTHEDHQNTFHANTGGLMLSVAKSDGFEFFPTSEIDLSDGNIYLAIQEEPGNAQSGYLLATLQMNREGVDVRAAQGTVYLASDTGNEASIELYGSDGSTANDVSKIEMKADRVQIKGVLYDKYETACSNGLAVYTGSGTAGIDPNTTLEHLVLTNHSNAPVSGAFSYIFTVFYNTKSTTANRAQYAFPYSTSGSMWHRYYYSGAWSEWKRIANSAELEEYLPLAGGTMSGNIVIDGTGTKALRFKNAGQAALDVAIIGGSNSNYPLYIYDYTNAITPARYNGDKTISFNVATYWNASLNMAEDQYLKFGTGHIIQDADESLKIASSDDTTRRVFLGKSSGMWTFCPASGSGQVALGTSNIKWGQIYSTASSILTSDRNEKNTISEMDGEFWRRFLMGLKPVTYKYNDGTSGRTHAGMIAQDVELLMAEMGVDSKEFAGFIKFEKEHVEMVKKPVKDMETGEEREIDSEILVKDYDEDGNPVYGYALRYDEFIAPIIATVQEQEKEISSLKAEIAELKKQFAEFMAKFED